MKLSVLLWLWCIFMEANGCRSTTNLASTFATSTGSAATTTETVSSSVTSTTFTTETSTPATSTTTPTIPITSMVCYTNGGPESNKPCVFPFVYHGIEYTACTTVENNGIAWCSTEVDFIVGGHVEGKWGNCGPECSGFVGLWIEEAPNMKCTTYNKTATVNNQRECQANCVRNSECVGILYSYKINFTQYCYICKDDNLKNVRNEFCFYRNPDGKFLRIPNTWCSNRPSGISNFNSLADAKSYCANEKSCGGFYDDYGKGKKFIACLQPVDRENSTRGSILYIKSVCADGEFQCDNDDCIAASRECDGFYDCDDASDELNCVTTTPIPCDGAFQCDNGNCISSKNECNNLDDCGDNSDEHEGCDFECGIKPVKIVGGSEVTPYSLPWQVAFVRRGSNQPFCGGTLISDRHILTAAHCTWDVGSYDVIVGEHNITSSSDGTRHSVCRSVDHPDNNHPNYLQNDVAILHLLEPVKIGQRAVPACLPPMSSCPSLDCASMSSLGGDFLAGKNMTVSGWGVLSENGESPTVLHSVNVPGITNLQCDNDYKDSVWNVTITKDMLCAGESDGGVDACQGDSGGPLTYTMSGRTYVVGVVSWGEGCARPGKPGVYARVTTAMQFINQELSKSC